MSILLLIILVIFLVILLSVRFKLHPFFALIISALICGVLLGQEPDVIIELLTEGFGNTLAGIGLVIAFGTIIGVCMEKSGAMQAIAQSLLRLLPGKRSPLAMNIVGFFVSIPVFCDSGFIILSSLNKVLSRKTGIPLVVFAVCLSTGLYATHVFVPPTPGPLAAAAMLNADVGLLMLLGFLVAFPVALTGALWGMFLGKTQQPLQPENGVPSQEVAMTEEEKRLNILMLLPMVLPILLIGVASWIDFNPGVLPWEMPRKGLLFLGSPVIALLIGAVLAMAITSGKTDDKKKWIGGALKDAGSIILITGAGGAFGNILRSADLGEVLQNEFEIGGSALIIAFVLSAIIKTAQGSSTVAIITTAAIFSPMMLQLGFESPVEKALTVLAIGAGALTVSHVNDSYFWVVSQFSDLNIKQALKSHTVATGIQGVTAMLLIILMQWLLG